MERSPAFPVGLQGLQHAPRAMQVAHMGPEELLAGEWTTSCLMLVMPGGADLPYCRQLNGLGNKIIRGAQP